MKLMKMTPPKSESELLHRAWNIAGLSLAELANKLDLDIPENLLRNKGWIGESLELALGATAGSKPEPDFQQIGVELKTIPIKENKQPKETTHVCTVPMINLNGMTWDNSLVREKLSRVLWIPIGFHEQVKLSERVIGAPFLWSPSADEETLLKTDWEEFMDMISYGELAQITAHLGEALQIRPKAADSYTLAESIGKNGERVSNLPRGFYLRTSFTASLLNKHYHLAS